MIEPLTTGSIGLIVLAENGRPVAAWCLIAWSMTARSCWAAGRDCAAAMPLSRSAPPAAASTVQDGQARPWMSIGFPCSQLFDMIVSSFRRPGAGLTAGRELSGLLGAWCVATAAAVGSVMAAPRVRVTVCTLASCM